VVVQTKRETQIPFGNDNILKEEAPRLRGFFFGLSSLLEFPELGLALRVRWGGVFVVMAVVEDLADAAACALGDLACAFGGSYADVLSGHACALADVACGVDGVEGDEVAGSLADAFGCGSGSLGGVLADVAGSAADVTAGAAGLGLSRGRSWLGVLGGYALGADCEGYGEEWDK
jgi:hypothetical protein